MKKFVVVANYYKIYYALGHLDDEEHLAIIQQLPVEIMKEIFNLILLFDSEDGNPAPDWSSWDIPSTGERFKYFLAWYSKNEDCGYEAILASFKLEDFTGEELLTVVKKSVLFPEEEIDKKCVVKFKKYQMCRTCIKK